MIIIKSYHYTLTKSFFKF